MSYLQNSSGGGGGGSGLTWNDVTGTSQQAAVNNGYIADNAGLCTITLPPTAVLGSQVSVAGRGAGGWNLAQNSGQSVVFGNKTTTVGVGGSMASVSVKDVVNLICTVANTEWQVISSVGNVTIV